MTLEFDVALARRVARQEFIKRALILFIAVMITFVVGILLYLVMQIRNTQIEGTPTGKVILQTSEDIKGCITPGEECYDRGQATAASAVIKVNQIITLTISCADRTGTQSLKQISTCVNELLEEGE